MIWSEPEICDHCGQEIPDSVQPIVLGPRRPPGWLELFLNEVYAPQIKKQLEQDSIILRMIDEG